jgi:IS30 family transposase
VNKRKVFGHWEIDAVEGKGHREAIATFLERVSRYYQAVKISNLDAEEAIRAHLSVLGMFPEFARKTATFDNGKENTNHTKLWQYYGILTYFCDPYCSWQKGSNENHNGLLRRYIPKKTDFSLFSQVGLDAMVKEMNDRPRKCLNYSTPKEVFVRYLQSRGGCDSH